MLVREAGRLVAACPLYVKQHSEGEFVFDWGWADAAERAGIAYYPKLLVGVPFTPVTGARFLVADAGERRSLGPRCSAAALRELCRENELSGVHVNFCRDDEIAPLAEAGYLLRLGFQYHWSNAGYPDFDDYLDALSQQAPQPDPPRAARARRAGCARDASTSGRRSRTSCSSRCTASISRRSSSTCWGRQYLNRRFFELLAERFRHRLCFVVARRGDELIAGTFNVVKKRRALRTLLGSVAATLRHLHFNVCYYAAIEYCIENGHRSASSPAPAAITSTCAASRRARPPACTGSPTRGSRLRSRASWKRSAPRPAR